MIEQGGTPAARWEWEVTLTGGVAAAKVFAAAFARAIFFYSYPKSICPKIAEIQKIVRRRRGGRPWPEVSPPFGTHFFSENASYAKKIGAPWAACGGAHALRAPPAAAARAQRGAALAESDK